MNNPLTAEECVANGVAFLDSKVPNWRELIRDRGPIEVSSLTNCPIGKLYGVWGRGLVTLFGHVGEVPKKFAPTHGFSPTASASSRVLNTLWDKEIQQGAKDFKDVRLLDSFSDEILLAEVERRRKSALTGKLAKIDAHIKATEALFDELGVSDLTRKSVIGHYRSISLRLQQNLPQL